MRRGFTPLLIVVTIAFLLGSSVLTYLAVNQNKKVPETILSESPKPISSPDLNTPISSPSPKPIKEQSQSPISPKLPPVVKPSANPMANWKTWESKYFTTTYPSGWMINFCTPEYANIDSQWDSVKCKYPYDPTVSDSIVNFYFNNENFQQYYSNKISKQSTDNNLTSFNQTKTSVNDFPAIRNSYTENNFKIVKYYINSNEKLFTISYKQGTDKPNKENDFDNIATSTKLHL